MWTEFGNECKDARSLLLVCSLEDWEELGAGGQRSDEFPGPSFRRIKRLISDKLTFYLQLV